ncbi:hypothetical protein BB561_004291 [Smittium simulii]|uniref:Mannose-P-dolichol utilization defect 1 protein homolog n=1 Tax=Smittium simulii TaxID=133385 RepID=A0A2T9YH30_9FUNG|nr:hypothetical protein BB561_004291 [Smittium simulii]
MSWLPLFLRAPIVSLIGENCTSIIVDDLNLFEPVCLKYSISKALGLAIVLGGCIVKLPQIFKILKARSAQGLSLSAFLLETLANIVNIAFSVRQGFPFTTYGESLFIGLQNYFITITILVLNGSEWLCMIVAALFVVVSYLLCDSSWTSTHVLSTLQTLSIPVVISSRLPQIMKIHKEKSTGQLSAFAVFNYFFGTAARVFTTFVEVDNKIILVGYLLSFFTNTILAAQMIYYWSPKSKSSKTAPKLKSG